MENTALVIFLIVCGFILFCNVVLMINHYKIGDMFGGDKRKNICIGIVIISILLCVLFLNQ